jgi:hypothetical protein
MSNPTPEQLAAAAQERLANLFRKPAAMEGLDEIDSLDQSLYGAATRLRRALRDPVVPKGAGAIISVTLIRREIEALVMLCDLLAVPDRNDETYLPSNLPLQN